MRIPLLLFFLTYLPASAAVLGGLDLGIFAPGQEVLVRGDSREGANEFEFYQGATAPSGNWGNEVLFEFSLRESAMLTLSPRSLGGDVDFFLLTGRGANVVGGKSAATDTIRYAFLDFGGPEHLGMLAPGRYLLSVDVFEGVDGQRSPQQATFDVLLGIQLPTDLGILGEPGEVITLNAAGSSFDPSLSLWDAAGNLVLAQPDRLDLQNLGVGRYFVGLAGDETSWSPTGFHSSSPGRAPEAYRLGHRNGVESGGLRPDQPEWFTFQVVPEPSSALLLSLSGLLLCRRQRS